MNILSLKFCLSLIFVVSLIPVGIILDKRRTFKRALRTSVAMGDYDPDEDKYDIQFRKKDRRYRISEKIEKPKYKAVVMYVGDVSYSTYGERLAMEKRIVNFIENWINYNYGAKNVEHRYFVHNYDSYEVSKEDFYMSEDGYIVFTKAYHLKRGYCCQSGCLHCPWDFGKNKSNNKNSNLKTGK